MKQFRMESPIAAASFPFAISSDLASVRLPVVLSFREASCSGLSNVSHTSGYSETIDELCFCARTFNCRKSAQPVFASALR